MMFHKVQLLVVLSIKNTIPDQFLPGPIEVQLLHTVIGKRMVFLVKLVGKQFRSAGKLWKISNTEYTHHTNSLTHAGPSKGPGAPVLEAGDEGVGVRVGFWLT